MQKRYTDEMKETEIKEKLANIDKLLSEKNKLSLEALLLAKKVKWYEVVFIGGGTASLVFMILRFLYH